MDNVIKEIKEEIKRLESIADAYLKNCRYQRANIWKAEVDGMKRALYIISNNTEEN